MPCPCAQEAPSVDAAAGVPPPKTKAPVQGGVEVKTKAPVHGGVEITARRGVARAAAAIIGLAVVVVIIAVVMRSRRAGERFFTPYATEEPTRPYLPYTGTVPFGDWDAAAGTKPWAAAVDLSPPTELDGLRAVYW